MAKIIDTRRAASEISDLLKDAGRRLILISPYLKLNKDFKQSLERRDRNNKSTTIIYRKDDLNLEDREFLNGLKLVRLKINEDLHAKCYVSDDKAIITSLNLYDFSIANNKELGVLIDRADVADRQLYDETIREISIIEDTSKDVVQISTNAASRQKSNSFQEPDLAYKRSTKGEAKSKQPHGYCIRTGVEIPFNTERPLSYNAYQRWVEYGDPDYRENYCHFSGERSSGETTVSKPIMSKNWKRAKAAFDL